MSVNVSYASKRSFPVIKSKLESFDYILDKYGAHQLINGYSLAYFNFENLESRRAYIHPKVMDFLREKGKSVTAVLLCDASDENYIAAVFYEGEWYSDFDKLLESDKKWAEHHLAEESKSMFKMFAISAVLLLGLAAIFKDQFMTNALLGCWVFGVIATLVWNGIPISSTKKSYTKIIDLFNKSCTYKKFP